PMAPERVTPFQGNLEAYHRAFGKFINQSSRLSPAQADQPGICGVWSARQVAAHLAGWEHEAARSLTAWLAQLAPMQDYDIDGFNANSVAMRSAWSWEEVLADLRAGHLALQHAVERLMVQHPSDYSIFTTWLGIMAEEFETHAAQLAEIPQS
ncbi:MAG: hypothetical protein HPY76_13810, partial [Anaerolineae bacterium]|nr:hypothetical protein [Anaerolineae bacterium]